MGRVIHFEIAADDPKRAVDFYKKVFGWEIQKWDGPMEYWLVETGKKEEAGINGAISSRANMKSQPIVNTIDVKSFEEAAAKISASGGKVLTPKMGVPGIGWMAYCLDSEGNQFGIMQTDPNAK